MKFGDTCAPFLVLAAPKWAPGEDTHGQESFIHRLRLRDGRGRIYPNAGAVLPSGRVVSHWDAGGFRIQRMSRNHSLSRITTLCPAGVDE